MQAKLTFAGLGQKLRLPDHIRETATSLLTHVTQAPVPRSSIEKLLEPGGIGRRAIGAVQGELRLSTLGAGRGVLAARTEKPVLVVDTGAGVPAIFTLDLPVETARAHAGEWVAVRGTIHKTNEFGGRISGAAIEKPDDPWSHIEIAASDVHETLGRVMLVDGFPLVFDPEKSHGQYLHDAKSGRDFLDMFTFFASRPVAFDHPGLLDPAYQRRLALAARVKPSNSDIYTKELASFVETFRRHAMPKEMAHLFLIDGGSHAVENALKTAFDWKTRKNKAAGKDVQADVVIHFQHAFHGRGGYALSLTNTDPKKTKLFPKFGTLERITSPAAADPRRVAEAEAEALRQIEEAYERAGQERVACIVLEPIQSEGGDHHFSKEFVAKLRAICDARETLLVFDEVQTGMGATGTMWYFEQLGVTPDIVAFAKKAQLGGIMATRRIDEVENHVFSESSRINSTFGGNLVDAVRATRFLEIIEKDGLLDNVTQQGAHLLAGLTELTREFDQLDRARGVGTILAFDVATPELRSKILASAYDEGLLILPCGERSIRIRAALDVTKDDCDRALEILRRAIAGSLRGRPTDSRE